MYEVLITILRLSTIVTTVIILEVINIRVVNGNDSDEYAKIAKNSRKALPITVSIMVMVAVALEYMYG